jgi:hypothetical protein
MMGWDAYASLLQARHYLTSLKHGKPPTQNIPGTPTTQVQYIMALLATRFSLDSSATPMSAGRSIITHRMYNRLRMVAPSVRKRRKIPSATASLFPTGLQVDVLASPLLQIFSSLEKYLQIVAGTTQLSKDMSVIYAKHFISSLLPRPLLSDVELRRLSIFASQFDNWSERISFVFCLSTAMAPWTSSVPHWPV